MRSHKLTDRNYLTKFEFSRFFQRCLADVFFRQSIPFWIFHQIYRSISSYDLLFSELGTQSHMAPKICALLSYPRAGKSTAELYQLYIQIFGAIWIFQIRLKKKWPLTKCA